jgi:hypothetical protein
VNSRESRTRCRGTGFLRVWVWVSPKLPAGHPCPSLATTELQQLTRLNKESLSAHELQLNTRLTPVFISGTRQTLRSCLAKKAWCVAGTMNCGTRMGTPFGPARRVKPGGISLNEMSSDKIVLINSSDMGTFEAMAFYNKEEIKKNDLIG